MIWQDYVATVIIGLFGFLLIPQIKNSRRGNHVSMWSSGPTAIGLYVLAVIWATLGLYASIVASIINGTAWAWIFIEAWRKP